MTIITMTIELTHLQSQWHHHHYSLWLLSWHWVIHYDDDDDYNDYNDDEDYNDDNGLINESCHNTLGQHIVIIIIIIIIVIRPLSA